MAFLFFKHLTATNSQQVSGIEAVTAPLYVDVTMFKQNATIKGLTLIDGNQRYNLESSSELNYNAAQFQLTAGNLNAVKKLLSRNTYNELGELITKEIGQTEQQPLQTVNYSYNIRGWLTAMNNPNNLGDDLFGMNLLYNQNHILADNAQYNGNISGYIWQSKHDNQLRNYGFAYDGLNRLKVADYHATDNTNFSVNNISYDRNGNIRSLTRYGMTAWNGGNPYYGIMDELNYTYGGGNQLQKVVDSQTDHSDTVNEFKNGTSGTGIDYSYDANGNLKEDQNKDITSILYNHLNLPTKVTFDNGDIVEWTYDTSTKKSQNQISNEIK